MKELPITPSNKNVICAHMKATFAYRREVIGKRGKNSAMSFADIILMFPRIVDFDGLLVINLQN